MKILLIRGGGLGDFIVTLPTLRLLREQWPEAHVEVLGHSRIAEIGVGRGYLEAVRSVNHGPLSAFFTPRAVLDPAWMDYIGSFDLVGSYFYDPDGLFLKNLERCKPGQILTHATRVPEDFAQPAARHFAGLLAPLGLTLGDEAWAEVKLTAEDHDAAESFLAGLEPGTRLVAIHPGSGSETKNWPVEAWERLGKMLLEKFPRVALVLVEGEADGAAAEALSSAWKGAALLRARWLPLPVLAAVLSRAELFLGHDSGVTHLAAATRRDLPVLAIFGPSNPAVWAPPRAGVTVLRGPYGIASLPVEEVFAAAAKILRHDGE